MPQLFACVLFCNPQYRKKAFGKAQAQHNNNLWILYHDSDMFSTKYCFEAESLPDRCQDCGKTVYQNGPAIRSATEKEVQDL